jgi:hypothetical protein
MDFSTLAYLIKGVRGVEIPAVTTTSSCPLSWVVQGGLEARIFEEK